MTLYNGLGREGVMTVSKILDTSKSISFILNYVFGGSAASPPFLLNLND